MNEYDEYAVEQAVQFKEQLGNEPEITILSVGPDRVVGPLAHSDFTNQQLQIFLPEI
jgi:electron transfer flavoprotein alpha/beta subunit